MPVFYISQVWIEIMKNSVSVIENEAVGTVKIEVMNYFF